MKLAVRIVTLISAASLAMAQSLTGLWDAVIHYDDLSIPFSIEFTGDGSQITASFFNGDERVTSTGGVFDGKAAVFRFDHYATRLEATLEDGLLKGTYGGKRSGNHDFEARPHHEANASPALNVPDIGGVWDVPTESPKGEHAWRLIVQQSGPKVSAAILRVDGDTGALTGRYGDGRFVLNHFDGARAAILEMQRRPDGTLALTLKGPHQAVRNLVAWKPEEARAAGVPAPTDPESHTRMKDPTQPFHFAFPDLDGRLVSDSDARFRHKVILVNITGSWCPNCHDEAPFLEELYRRYHSLGMETVALDFEEPEQLADKTRLRAFIKKYGIGYTYLVAGQPDELQAKVSQAENLNSWPTTFFLGRDGKVRLIHAGFAAAASGDFHTQLKRKITDTIERLLAENGATSTTALNH